MDNQQNNQRQEQAAPKQEQGRNNGPIETLRDGALKVAIFRNDREKGVSFAMEPGRLYTDGQGQVKEAKSLSGSEPVRMARLLNKGYDRIGEFKAKIKVQSQTQDRER